MKKNYTLWLLWLAMTAAVITVGNYYFENWMNVPSSSFVTLLGGLTMGVIVATYIVFTVKLIIKTINP